MIRGLNGSANTLLLSDGTTASIGSGLRIVSDTLKLGAVAGGANAKGIVISNAGNDYNITTSATTDTLKLPNASATASGLVTNANQEFAGIKTFTDTLSMGDYNGVLFNTQSALTANDFGWKLGLENTVANLNHFSITSNGNNRLFFSPSATLQYQSSTTNNTLLANSIETMALKKTGGASTDLFRANGTTVKHVFNDHFRFQTNGTRTNQIGIGLNTTQPTALFEINGSGYGANYIFKVSSGNDVAMSSNTNATGTYSGWSLMRNHVERWFLGLGRTRNYLTMLGVDSVGIGTVAPSEKLQVMGTVAASSFIIPNGNSGQLMGSAGNAISLGSNISIVNGQMTGSRPTFSQATWNPKGGIVMVDDYSDYFVIMNSSGAVMPPPSSKNIGRKVNVKNLNYGSPINLYVENYSNSYGAATNVGYTNPITGVTTYTTFVDPLTGATKNGQAFVLTGGTIISFVSDGTNWYQTR